MGARDRRRSSDLTSLSRATREPVSRRQFASRAGAALAGAALGVGWLSRRTGAAGAQGAAREGRLAPRPRPDAVLSLKSGPLGLGGGDRDGVVQMPSTVPTGPLPMLLLLHGATQTGARLLTRLATFADQAGVVVVAPDSRGGTWDAIRDEFGDDVMYLNRVLEHVFARLPVDPARTVVGGFSDGASYALSLGLANGDLFPRVVAFSPGFVIDAPPHGRPRIFMSHGTADQILPIDLCSRQIAPRLRSRGYDVTFREFDGRHEVPPAIATEGFRWMLA